MIAKCYSMVFTGLISTLVEVEVNGSRGQPALIFIGLPNKAIDEAKERITAAFAFCGVQIKNMRTVVNLAPAEVKKTSSALELAIAVGLLNLYGFSIETADSLFFGELSLDGRIKKVRGLFSMILAAKKIGIKNIFFPAENINEVAMIHGINLFPLTSLKQVIKQQWKKLAVENFFHELPLFGDLENEFYSIVGQQQAKRAMAIAAAGKHNLIFIGSPGSGKSVLAKSIISLLPPLSEEEAIEVTNIYSIKGLDHHGIIKVRPFREPHHSSSLVGILGGGKSLSPGEISLAHHGVLFLDEFLEYPRLIIESLRQPIETGKITITRSIGTVTYPAKFMLVAAANPCPCGLWYQDDNLCSCTEKEKTQYRHKLSGPILDRIDLQVKVKTISSSCFLNHQPDKLSLSNLKNKIIDARVKQLFRQGYENYFLDFKSLKKLGNINQQAWQLGATLANKFHFSNRSFLKIMKVARTIADLENKNQVSQIEIEEAFSYRLNQ